MRSYSYLMSDVSGGGHYVELQESKLFYLIRLILEQVDVELEEFLVMLANGVRKITIKSKDGILN